MPSRLILLHGFTQSRASWAPLGPLLDRDGGRVLVTPDCPGHGARSAVRAGLWEGASLLADEAGRGDWLGYSMGGRFALHVALGRPDAVERLVLVSATPGIDDPAERAARRAEDSRRASRLQREGVEDFLAGWLAAPMFASLPPEARGMESRLTNTAGGLASSLRLAGTGSQDPLWDRLTDVNVPVLVVVGDEDHKFRALGERMVSALPDARLATIAHAGHAVPWEQPEAFAEAVNDFLG